MLAKVLTSLPQNPCLHTAFHMELGDWVHFPSLDLPTCSIPHIRTALINVSSYCPVGEFTKGPPLASVDLHSCHWMVAVAIFTCIPTHFCGRVKIELLPHETAAAHTISWEIVHVSGLLTFPVGGKRKPFEHDGQCRRTIRGRSMTVSVMSTLV